MPSYLSPISFSSFLINAHYTTKTFGDKKYINDWDMAVVVLGMIAVVVQDMAVSAEQVVANTFLVAIEAAASLVADMEMV